MPYGDLDLDQHLDRVMACCLIWYQAIIWTNIDWLTINEVLGHSPEGSFTGNAEDIYRWYDLGNYWFKIKAKSLKGHWVMREIRPPFLG